MKVLMISGDPDASDLKTETGKRIEEYRSSLGEFDVLICHGNLISFIRGFVEGYRLMRNGPDVISAQGIEHSLVAWILSKIFKTPWQMQIHTDIFSPYFGSESMLNKLRVSLAKFLMPKASGIRVVSERIKKSLLDFNISLKDKIIVLPVFVDTGIYNSYIVNTDLHQKYPDKFVILMASRITREKNIVLAIEAINDLNALLVIVGDGPEVQNLKNMAGKNIIFEPYAKDLTSYYKTCDLFLLTSNYEGYGRTLIEAASSGAKIISSDVGIAREILDEENIFRIGDMAHLKKKLEIAIVGKIKAPRPISRQTKVDYLKLYVDSFELCLIKKKNQ